MTQQLWTFCREDTCFFLADVVRRRCENVIKDALLLGNRCHPQSPLEQGMWSNIADVVCVVAKVVHEKEPNCQMQYGYHVG